MIVIIITAVKVVFQYFHWEILSVTPLHTGLLAGSVFVLGFILSSTHTDYKESEKMPVELTTAIESIHQDSVLCKQEYPDFKLNELQTLLNGILIAFREDVQNHTDNAFVKAKELAQYFKQMEKLGIPANYIVKLKQEQNTIIKIILRMHYLQKIQPLPSAFILVKSIVFIIIAMLLLTKIGDLRDEIIVTAFISFIYIYILKLIKVMDTPFHPSGATQDDISLFLLKEQQERLK